MYGDRVEVINYDYGTNDVQFDYWYPYDDPSTTTSVNISYTIVCPHCNGWVWNYRWFKFCPFCGKSLVPVIGKKMEILKRLDKILKEIGEIKEKLESEE